MRVPVEAGLGRARMPKQRIGGLIMPGERKIEEIWIELSLEPNFFSKKSGRVGLRILRVHI